jgi:hypothetical protein
MTMRPESWRLARERHASATAFHAAGGGALLFGRDGFVYDFVATAGDAVSAAASVAPALLLVLLV